MTEQMTWADFGKNLSIKVDAKATTFSTPLGNYFTVGKHQDVKIVSVTPAQGKKAPYLKFQFENDFGANIRANIFLTGESRNGGEEVNYKYKQLLASIVPNNPALALEFHTAAIQNPSLFAGLVGLRLSFETDLENDGYSIVTVGDAYQIQDQQTKSRWEGTDLHNSLGSAIDQAKEMQLNKARVQVKRFLRVSQQYEGGNNEALRTIVTNAASPASTNNKVGGQTVRRATI
jgi:hypothetical protein